MEKLKIHSLLLLIGIFIGGILVGSLSTMLVARIGESQRIPSVQPTSYPVPSWSPTGSAPGSGSSPNEPATGTPWSLTMRTYTDTKFGFSIGYLDTDFIKDTNTSTITPSPVHQVVFYDKELAKSDTADLQPPTCAIYVYTNNDRTQLPQWITNYKPYVSQNGTPKSVTIGNTQGYKVTFSIMIYPGEFYYVEQGSSIYEFIYCRDEVLRTFRTGFEQSND